VAVVSQNVYYAGHQGFRSMMGDDPGAGCRKLLEAGADVVGASCGLMKARKRRTRAATTVYDIAGS